MRKVFIIYDAERMLNYSANALLKTFEEPSLDSVIILLTQNHNAILPTILSRCRMIRFQAISDAQKNKAAPFPTFDSILDSSQHKSKSKSSNLSSEATSTVVSIRSEVFAILSKGKTGTYTDLSKSASHLADLLEDMQKEHADVVKSELQKMATDQLNAHQKQAMEKEAEGAAAMHLNQHAKSLLRYVLSWYRDLHLIHVGGRPELLENPDFREEIVQAYQRGEILPLEFIEKKVKEVFLSLERSTAINLCLEKLFIELQLI